MRKLSVDEQRELIPDDAIYQAWLDREDVRAMNEAEHAAAWQRHLEGVNWFREKMASIPAIVIGAAPNAD